MRLGAAALLLTTAGVLFTAATVQARIEPQRGIAGIALTMTRAEVIEAKGRPDAEKVIPHSIIGRQRMMRYGATKAFLGAQSGVITVRTTDPAERTRTGVGMGSTAAELRAGVAGIKCRREYGIHHCWKGVFRVGERVTDFLLEAPTYVTVAARRNRPIVSAITVSFVID